MRFKFIVREKLEQQLRDLKDKEDMDVIREAIIENSLLSEGDSQKVTMEELKKLIRLWRLHETRGFWKTHPNYSDLVSVLLEYIELQRRKKKSHEASHFQPSPPKTMHPFVDHAAVTSLLLDNRHPSSPDGVSPRKLRTQLFAHTNAGFKDPESLVYYSRIRQSVPMAKSLRLSSEPVELKTKEETDNSIAENAMGESKAAASFVMPVSDADLARKLNECTAFLSHSSEAESPDYLLSHGGMRFIQDLSNHQSPEVCLYALAITRNMSQDEAACQTLISNNIYHSIWNAFQTITICDQVLVLDDAQASLYAEEKASKNDKKVAWPKRPTTANPKSRDGERPKKRTQAPTEMSPRMAEAQQHIVVTLVHFSVNLDENRVLSSPVVGKLLTRLFQDSNQDTTILLMIFLNNTLQSVERQQLSTMIFLLAKRQVKYVDILRVTNFESDQLSEKVVSHMHVLMTSIKSCASFSMIRSHIFEFFFEDIVLETLRIVNEEIAKPNISGFTFDCAIRIESAISECLYLVSGTDTLQILVLHRGLEMVCKLHDLCRCTKALSIVLDDGQTVAMKSADFFLVELFGIFLISEDIREQAFANRCMERLLSIGQEYIGSIETSIGHINGTLKAIGILGSSVAQLQSYQPKTAPPSTNPGKMIFSKNARRTKTVTLTDSIGPERRASIVSEGDQKATTFSEPKRDQLAKIIQGCLSNTAVVHFAMNSLKSAFSHQSSDNQCLRVVALSLAVLRVLCFVPTNATLLKESISSLCECLSFNYIQHSSNAKSMELHCCIRNLAAICLKGMTRSVMLAEYIGSDINNRLTLIRSMTDSSSRVMVSCCEIMCAISRASAHICKELWECGFVEQATIAVKQTVRGCGEQSKIIQDDLEKMNGEFNSKQGLDFQTISKIQGEIVTLSGVIPTLLSAYVYSCKIFPSCTPDRLSSMLGSLQTIVDLINQQASSVGQCEDTKESESNGAKSSLFPPAVLDDICHVFNILCSSPYIRESRQSDAIALARILLSIISGNKSILSMSMTIWLLSSTLVNDAIEAQFMEELCIAKWIVMAMRGGQDKAQIFCARAMLNLSVSSKVSTTLTKAGIVHDFVVVALLRTNNDEVKAICSQALFNFLSHSSIRMSVCETGSVKAITKFSSLESESVKTISVSTIFNLSEENARFLPLLRECSVFKVLADLCSSPNLQMSCLACLDKIISKLLLGGDASSKKRQKDTIDAGIKSNEWLCIIEMLEKLDFAYLDTEKLNKMAVWLYYLSLQLDGQFLIHILSTSDIIGLLCRIVQSRSCSLRTHVFMALTANKIFVVSSTIKQSVASLATVDLMSLFLSLPNTSLVEGHYEDDFDDSVSNRLRQTRNLLNMTLSSLHVLCDKTADRRTLQDRDEIFALTFCISLQRTDSVSLWSLVEILSQLLPATDDAPLPHFFRDLDAAKNLVGSMARNACEVVCDQTDRQYNLNSVSGVASLLQCLLVLVTRLGTKLSVTADTIPHLLRLCVSVLRISMVQQPPLDALKKESMMILLLFGRILRVLSLSNEVCHSLIQHSTILETIMNQFAELSRFDLTESGVSEFSFLLLMEECCWDFAHVFVRLSSLFAKTDLLKETYVETFLNSVCEVQAITRCKDTSNVLANCVFRLQLTPNICYSENGQKLAGLARHAEQDAYTRAFTEQIVHGWDVEEPQLGSIESSGFPSTATAESEDFSSRSIHNKSRCLTKVPLSPFSLESGKFATKCICERSTAWYSFLVVVSHPTKGELQMEDILRVSLSTGVSVQWDTSRDRSSIMDAVDSAILSVITTTVDSGRSRRPDSRGAIMASGTGPSNYFLALIPDEVSRKVLTECGIGRTIITSIKYLKIHMLVEVVEGVWSSPSRVESAHVSRRTLSTPIVSASAVTSGDFRQVIDAINRSIVC